MKVLLLNSICCDGSTGNIVADLALALRDQGDDPFVLYGIGENRRLPPENCFRFNDRKGYLRHNLMAKLTDRTGLYSTGQTKRAIEMIEAFAPDLIHLHTLHGYYVNYEILFRYLSQAGIPVVWTLHDCWAFTGHCPHFTMVGCEQWKTRCVSCPLLRDYPKSWLLSNVKGNFERKKRAVTSVPDLTIVTPSDWLGDLARQSFLGKYPVVTIHNGINREVFHARKSSFRSEYRLENKKLLLGVANVWNSRKGFNDFLTLARMLGDDYRIVLAGLKKEQMESLPENVIGLGRIQDPVRLAELYSTADLFLNPTYEDTFPTVNLEAQACGTPVVTYDVG